MHRRANLFLAAAPRSGSTQLVSWIGQHPDVGVPAIKEPNHFSAHDFDPGYVAATYLNDVDPAEYASRGRTTSHQFAVFRDAADYDYLYTSLGERWLVDASTSYLASPGAPARIEAEVVGPRRAVVLLREPVGRAISHHGLALRTGRSRGTLADELAREQAGLVPPEARYLLTPSRYADALERWWSVIGREDVRVLTFERLVAEPAVVLAELFDWLGLEPVDVELHRPEARNQSVRPRFGWLNEVMLRSGTKTALRRVVPVGLKRRLKRVYFAPRPEPIATTAERHLLDELLRDDREATMRLVPEARQWWTPS